MSGAQNSMPLHVAVLSLFSHPALAKYAISNEIYDDTVVSNKGV